MAGGRGAAEVPGEAAEVADLEGSAADHLEEAAQAEAGEVRPRDRILWIINSMSSCKGSKAPHSII